MGYGHLVRSSALAEEILSRDASVTYVTNTPDAAEKVCPSNVSVVEIESRTNPETLLDTIESVDIVVVDSYDADEKYQQVVRDCCPLVLVSDTVGTVCADIVVNGNLYAPELSYEWTRNEPEWLFGPEYVLLRQVVREYAKRDPPWREDPEWAIIVMGGSDTENLTPTVVRAFGCFGLSSVAPAPFGFSTQSPWFEIDQS